MSQEKWFIFIILVPSKNDNGCPRKSGLYSLYYCLFCLPLCRAHCLLLRLKLSRMATLSYVLRKKMVFGVVLSKNDNRCPRKSSLSSLYLSSVKTIIGVPGNVVSIHYSIVYCARLCRAFCPSFRLKLNQMVILMEKS